MGKLLTLTSWFYQLKNEDSALLRMVVRHKPDIIFYCLLNHKALYMYVVNIMDFNLHFHFNPYDFSFFLEIRFLWVEK